MPAAVLVATLLSASAGAQESVRVLVDAAREQAAAGHTARAVDALRKARALAPNSEEVLSAYARASLAARAPREAIGVLEALARMCPAVADYPYLLGVARLQVGDAPAATDALRAAEALEPNRVLTLVALGLALNDQKLYSDAKGFLVRAIDLQPESLQATAALAEANEGMGELDAAEAEAQTVVSAATGPAATATARLVLGMVAMKRGRFAEARDALLAAAGEESTQQKAHYQLSLVYARLGDEAASQRHLELYRRARHGTNPPNPENEPQ